MKPLILIVLILSLTITMPAIAADKDGFVVAMGDITCEEWVSVRKKNSYIYEEGWIAGYMSAYNLLTPEVINILGNTDMDSIYLWVDNYCQEKPLSSLFGAMRILTQELWPSRNSNELD